MTNTEHPYTVAYVLGSDGSVTRTERRDAPEVDLAALAREVVALANERAETEYVQDWVEYESYARYVTALRSTAAWPAPKAGKQRLVCSVVLPGAYWGNLPGELLDAVAARHPEVFDAPGVEAEIVELSHGMCALVW